MNGSGHLGGADVIDLAAVRMMNDPATMDLLLGDLALQAEQAKADFTAFFEFVIREETTREPLVVAPHQRIVMDFIAAHSQAVVMLPIGCSKTYIMAALTLWLLGRDPTMRGAVVSATESQAEKVVKMVADYIRSSDELHAVFPDLIPSRNDPWTRTSITVQRPPTIRDASVTAFGYSSNRIPGSRLNWIVVDDLVVPENSASDEGRTKLAKWFDGELRSRLDGNRPTKLIVTNTPRHPRDLLHDLQKRGWPTLRMDIMGGVHLSDDRERMAKGEAPWDHPGLRPATASRVDYSCRLAEHDPDPANQTMLWPARWSREKIDFEKRNMLPHEFNQVFMCMARNDDEAMCKETWVDACKQKARDRGIFTMAESHTGDRNFTGVDLAFRQNESADYTAFFTFEQLPDGHRRILDVEYGRWDIGTIANRLIDKQKRFNSVVRVENNSAQQMFIDVMRKLNVSFPIYEHTTGKNKSDPGAGVQRIFFDMYAGLWLIPNDRHGVCHPMVERWVRECLDYTPTSHTGDGVMSAWFAREQCRAWGMLGNVANSNGISSGPDLGMSILSR